jgi:hypothetical protein
LTQAVLKNIEPSIFNEFFTKSPKNGNPLKWGFSELCISRIVWPIELKFFLGAYINKFYLQKKFQLKRLTPWYSMDFTYTGKIHYFSQLWGFISHDWKEIEV